MIYITVCHANVNIADTAQTFDGSFDRMTETSFKDEAHLSVSTMFFVHFEH